MIRLYNLGEETYFIACSGSRLSLSSQNMCFFVVVFIVDILALFFCSSGGVQAEQAAPHQPHFL